MYVVRPVSDPSYDWPECLEDVEFATLAWVDWFNNKRLLVPIGDMPAVEKEGEYYRKLEVSAMAA